MKPIDFDAVLAMKRLMLEREVAELESRVDKLGGFEWQKEYDLLRLVRRLKVKGFEHFGRLYAPPPKMRPAYPIIPATVSDWDFESAWDTYFDLDTVIYRSAPSSLRSKDGYKRKVCCNYPGTTDLPEGRISSWFYKNGSGWTRTYGFCCRLQYPTWANCYTVEQSIEYGGGGDRWVYLKEGGVDIKTASISSPPAETWFESRFTWWESGGWLVLRFERYYAGAWHNDFGDCLDMTPSYTSGVRRCGLYIGGHATVERMNADDTCIYGP